MPRSAFLARSPDGKKSLAVLYADEQNAPAVIAVATPEQWAARFPQWTLLRVLVTWEQYNFFRGIMLKRTIEARDKLKAFAADPGRRIA